MINLKNHTLEKVHILKNNNNNLIDDKTQFQNDS